MKPSQKRLFLENKKGCSLQTPFSVYQICLLFDKLIEMDCSVDGGNFNKIDGIGEVIQ